MTQPQKRVYYVVSLPEPLYQLQLDLLARAVKAGLIDPDELTMSGALWDRVRNAEPIIPPDPPTPDAVASKPMEEMGVEAAEARE